MFPFPRTGISRTQKTIGPIQVPWLIMSTIFLYLMSLRPEKNLVYHRIIQLSLCLMYLKDNVNTDIFDLLDANNIIHVIVPANTTDKLQPLDLSVNKPAKDFMKNKFQGWYGEVIRKQLEDQVEVEVDMSLSVMKPLVGNWIIDMYHYFQSKPNIIINGFHAAGIVDTLASKKIITP